MGSPKLILTPGTRATASGPQGLGGRQIESGGAGAIAARRGCVCPAPCAPPAVPVCAAVRLAGGVSGCTGGRAPAAAAAQVGPVVGHAPSPGAPICEGPAAGPPPTWLSACVARENLAGWGTVTWGLWERYSADGRIHPEILAHPTSHPSLASPPKTPIGWATLEAAPSPGARLSEPRLAQLQYPGIEALPGNARQAVPDPSQGRESCDCRENQGLGLQDCTETGRGKGRPIVVPKLTVLPSQVVVNWVTADCVWKQWSQETAHLPSPGLAQGPVSPDLLHIPHPTCKLQPNPPSPAINLASLPMQNRHPGGSGSTQPPRALSPLLHPTQGLS